MKKPLLLLIMAILCLMASNAIAQVNLSNYSTYTLEVPPFRTQYGNTLTEKDIELNFNNLHRVEENGDLYIRVNFIKGLTNRYLLQTAIPGTGFAYKVNYSMPRYRVSIIDNEGKLILQKVYGGEKKTTIFGEYERISSVEDLKTKWEEKRDAFYANLEKVPEEIPTQEMDEELISALQPIDETSSTKTDNETMADVSTVQRTQDRNGRKPKVNIYRRLDKKSSDNTSDDNAILSSDAEQIYDLNGFIAVEACSKYNYQLQNTHPFATLSVSMQENPAEDPQQFLINPGEIKYFKGLPHKQAWILVTYPDDNFQVTEIDFENKINAIGNKGDSIQITDVLNQFFEEGKTRISFAPKFNAKDEVIDYAPENDIWEDELRTFLDVQENIKLSRTDQSKIIKQLEALLTAKTLRRISDKIEQDIDNEDKQRLIAASIKDSKNFKNSTPLVSLEFGQSISAIGNGINEYWNQQKNSRASISVRLPFEWPLVQGKNGSFSTLNFKVAYEALTLDFNRAFQAYAIDPESGNETPEMVLEDEQFAIQATQLSAGLAWRFYLPIPIIEIEGGAFFSNKTRLLWGQDQGQFPRSIFNPENEIISDVVDLSTFRPYVGFKVGIPFYFSGYKFNCDSSLKNIHLFAGLRMYPVNFSKNDNYKVFLRDAADVNFIPIPLEDGKSKFLIHLMVGGAAEF